VSVGGETVLRGAGTELRVEEALAGWVSGFEVGALPPSTRARVEDIFLDALASAFAGRTQRLLDQVDDPARAFGGAGAATVIHGKPASAATAVFLNAYAVTSATLCDVYRPALCHVTPVVLPPLLALAEEIDATWSELLAAFTVGLELTVRLARALDYPAMRSRGWHSPGVVGPVGAAGAAARLLRLDPVRAGNALAHGAAQGAGTFAALGTEAVKFNQARGAVSGLLAALMGSAGLAAAGRWLTHGDGGMGSAYSNGGAPEQAIAALGSEWELMEISLRRWPASSSVQSLIDACLSLREDEGIARDAVASVEVELGPDAYLVSGPRGFAAPRSAQQSARWVVSAVLEDGDWWLEQSSPGRIADAASGAFADGRVVVTVAEGLGQAGVRLHVDLADGSEHRAVRSDAPGDPACPLTRAQIEQKLRRAAAELQAEDAAEGLIAFVRDGDGAAPVGALIRRLGGAA
jgi:2-methylcitrate dehydratase PrpD